MNKKIICLGCLKKKEQIDEMERYLLVIDAWVKQLRKDITQAVQMKDELEIKMARVKLEWEKEWMGCVEEEDKCLQGPDGCSC